MTYFYDFIAILSIFLFPEFVKKNLKIASKIISFIILSALVIIYYNDIIKLGLCFMLAILRLIDLLSIMIK